MERKLVLEATLANGRWGLLEMYLLLTDDIVELKVCFKIQDYLDIEPEYRVPDIDIKLDYKNHPDLFLSLLIARCPVSDCISTKTSTD